MWVQLQRPVDRQLHLELRAAEDARGGVERVCALHLVDHRRLEVARPARREQLRRDAEDLGDCTVRLLAPSALRVGELDQTGLQQHAHVKVEMPGIDPETLRQLTVGELPLPFLAEHLEHADAQRMA